MSARRKKKKGGCCNRSHKRRTAKKGAPSENHKSHALTLPRGDSSCFCARTATRETRDTRRGARADEVDMREARVDCIWRAAIVFACFALCRRMAERDRERELWMM